MKKITNKNKIVVVVAIIILAVLNFINSVYATNINSANLYSIGDCGSLLKYKGMIVKVSYVQYTNEGEEYPAYCLDKTKKGVGDIEYSVSIDKMINDVGLWRVIINGYPYKSIQELNVANKEEAFTATKQAIYCYIHENKPEDYEGIGEAGERTLNAMKQIISNAQNSKEIKISNNVKIIKDKDKWKQDKIDKKYISKEFSILSETQIQNYKIKITSENEKNIEGIKLTDLQNKEKEEFSPNEKFKILIPIKNLTDPGNINIKVETKMKTKPILYGKAPDSSYQDYALTAKVYEDSTGEEKESYTKNETKIIILKQDKETKKILENVEFQILDENKNIIYTGLKTNKEGKIVVENLMPGKYFIKEVNTIKGYQKYEELIEAVVSLNEEYTIKVYNNKEKEPEITTDKKEKSKEVKAEEIKRLPITGM